MSTDCQDKAREARQEFVGLSHDLCDAVHRKTTAACRWGRSGKAEEMDASLAEWDAINRALGAMRDLLERVLREGSDARW